MLARIVIVVIAFWTLIQALAYGTMAILAILVHNCQIAMDDSQLSQWMYAIYFRDNACAAINWNELFDKKLSEQPQLPDITLITFRTNAIAMIYLAISLLWLLTSFMLIVAACVRPLTKRKYYFLFHPWIYASLLNILLDLTATGFFIYDLVKSSNIESLLRHLEVKNVDRIVTEINTLDRVMLNIESLLMNLEVKNAAEIAKEVEALDKIAMIPSLIFIGVTMRALVIWIFNIVEIFVVVRMGNEIVNKLKRDKKKTTTTHHVDYITDTEQNNEQYNSSSQLTEQTRYNDPPTNYQYDNFGQEYDRYPKVLTDQQKKRERKLSESAGDDQQSRRNSHLRNSAVPDTRQIADQRSKHRISSDAMGKDSKKRESMERSLHGNEKNVLAQSGMKIDRPHLRVTNASKPRTSHQESEEIIQPTNPRRTSLNATDELRSQLPWSYFKSRNDIARPKKPFQNLRDDEDLPPVPVPDYTMHFSRKDRYSDDGNR